MNFSRAVQVITTIVEATGECPYMIATQRSDAVYPVINYVMKPDLLQGELFPRKHRTYQAKVFHVQWRYVGLEQAGPQAGMYRIGGSKRNWLFWDWGLDVGIMVEVALGSRAPAPQPA